MSDADVDDDVGADDDIDVDLEGGEDEGRKFSTKKLILFIGVPAIVILLGLVAVFFLVDFGGDEKSAEDQNATGEAGTEEAGGEVIFFDLPELLVNLNTGTKKASYLKIKVALELPGLKSQERVQAMLPRVLDNMQVYLRELRLEDLSGSAGVQRLKEELVTRVNATIEPAKINDVLFKEMLVQ